MNMIGRGCIYFSTQPLVAKEAMRMNRRSEGQRALPSHFMSFLSLLGCLFITASSSVQAQQIAAASQTASQLPDAPDAQPAGTSAVLVDGKGTASISGVVIDPNGGVVENARVALEGSDGVAVQTVQSGSGGEFTLQNLPAGVFRVTVTATGFAPSSSEPITVTGGQTYIQPSITLYVANANTEVHVLANNPALAQLEIKAEEKQRVLGFAPNFYESFIDDAVPLTAKQKFSFAFRDTFDPTRFFGAAVQAGIQQANGSYKGYGFGAAGYGKRYAAAYGDGLTSDILSHAVFPVIFHQDPRYFYQGTGSNRSRFIHAVSSAVVARSDSGRTIPNYSYLLGDIGSGALSNLYYPHADRGVGLVFTNAAIGIAGRAIQGIIEEFVFPRLTSHRPDKVKP